MLADAESEKWWHAEPGKSATDSSPKWKEWEPAPLASSKSCPGRSAPAGAAGTEEACDLRGAEKGFVFTAAFSERQTLAYGGGDNDAILWDLCVAGGSRQ